MDLQVYIPTFNIEKYESLPFSKFLELLDESTNRRNAFFDETIVGYIVLTNMDELDDRGEKVYQDVLQKSLITLDLAVHPSKNNNPMHTLGITESYLIQSSTYTYKDHVFSKALQILEEDDDGSFESRSTANNETLATTDSSKDEQENYVSKHITVWKFVLPISYPKQKINNPEIIISISLTIENTRALLQQIELNEKYANKNNSKLMLNDNGSTDELTLKQVYKPVQDVNLLEGLDLNILSSNVQPVILPGFHFVSDKSQDQPTGGSFSFENSGSRRNSAVSSVSGSDFLPKVFNLDARILLPVYPVLNMRLKCTKSAGRNDILLTNLEIESSKELNKINMILNLLEMIIEFPNGSIKPVIPESMQKFPIEVHYNDNLNFIYELINNTSSENLFTKPVLITLISRPIPKDETDAANYNNSSKIVTKWSTIVDFSIVAPPTNTALKLQSSGRHASGVPKPSQRNSIISSLSPDSPQVTNKKTRNSGLFPLDTNATADLISSPRSASSLASPVINSTTFSMGVNTENGKSVHGDLHQKLKRQSRASSTSLTVNIPRTSKSSVLNGLILSFHGTTNVRVGEVFKWKIQAINKSHRVLNLSLYIQPKDNNNHSFLTSNITEKTPKLSGSYHSSSNLGFDSEHNKVNGNQIIYPYITPAASSDVNLRKVFNQTKLTPTGIICLNNDVRIGPFDHYSVFETEINLIAIEKGIFSLQGVKIIDITSGESFDCGKLLEVVVIV